MNTLKIYFLVTLLVTLFSCESEKKEITADYWDTSINFGWKFSKGDQHSAMDPGYDFSSWESIDLPHDWAISGPFDSLTAPGHTGKLPWKGEGWYSKSFDLPADANGKQLQFLFDGVMANPTIYLNGKKVGSWRYGYNSFWIDATDAALFGHKNTLVVHADTRKHDSRWYPGAGIYRKISMRLVEPLHIPVWGIYVTTPKVSNGKATVKVEVTVSNSSDQRQSAIVDVDLFNPEGKEITDASAEVSIPAGQTITKSFEIEINNPEIWDIESPNLYRCVAGIEQNKKEINAASVNFGVRTFEWTANDGFHLNGRRVQLYGVNLHHDHGPLGAAFYPRAMQRQLEIMKNMGVNAIRTSHNACAPELLDLCDKMGFIVFNELFDKYGPTASVQCSTGEFVDKYAETEVKNFVLRDRNHASVFLWSIGNEIPDLLFDSDSLAAKHIADMVKYFKQFDTTRPTTMGCHIPSVSEGGKKILDALETTGWNYDRRYVSTRKAYPNMPIIYSETASAFGSRGAYKLVHPKHKNDWGTDGNITAYMLTAAPWSDIPEIEFEYMRIDTFVAGEFVWTGFDYLGEPTPFVPGDEYAQTTEGYVARSSYFGIVDLAGLPKDSYYNYRSLWNKKENTVYLAPHWNWQGHEGEKIPVMVYTNGDEAELFLNGKSLGRKKKINPDNVKTTKKIREAFENTVKPNDNKTPYYEIVDAYRLCWPGVTYEKGELKAVAYKNGKEIGESVVKTAGNPDKLKLAADRNELVADGMDLCYVTIEMIDAEGNTCPLAMDNLTLKVEGAAKLMGVDNGDAMGHDSFTDNTHPLFYGKAVAVLKNIPGKSGSAILKVGAESVGEYELKVSFNR